MSDTLRCSKCRRDLPADDFSTDNKAPTRGFRSYMCRECDATRAFLRWKRNRQLIHEVKYVPCADCGVRYPAHIMQFDHVRGKKEFDIGAGHGRALQKLKDEMAKCDVVCANCHEDRTHKRRQQALQRGETVGCIVPRGTRLSPKTQTPSLPDALTLF